jgi:pimeloyl-ACP methyl ester carboxylesterase
MATPRASFEELEIHTKDGASLRAIVDDPLTGQPLRGTLVLAHALFANKSSFGRRDAGGSAGPVREGSAPSSSAGLVGALTKAGFRTVAFDFRGYGDSTSPAEPAYDDFVRCDLPAVIDYARASGADRPVVVVGHALGGQIALASQGGGHVDVDGIVALATTVWVRELEPSRLLWAAKAAFAGIARTVSTHADAALAKVPWLEGVDPNVAASRHVREILEFSREGRWRSTDGREDYLAQLGHVTVPVAAVLAERDHVVCPPLAGEAFARRCAGRVRVLRVPVGHGDLVTSPLAEPVVLEAVSWVMASRLGPDT